MANKVGIRGFLAHCKATLQEVTPSSTSKPITLVIGNESADLDSICSALVYAYILTNVKSTPRLSSRLHIPITNIPTTDLKLRPELSYILSKISCEEKALVTLDDIRDSPFLKPRNGDGDSGVKHGKTSVILVDHNSITGILKEKFGKDVVGCIDHHEDENKVPFPSGTDDKAMEPPPRIIEKAGSCMSLVIEHCRHHLQGGMNDINQDEVSLLAIAPILVDTNNLKDSTKTTSVDISSAKFLENNIGNGDYDNVTFFNALTEAKSSIDSLSLSDILRKDYKSWRENSLSLGIASVVKPVSFLLGKAGSDHSLARELEMFSRDRMLDICVIMTTFNDNEGKFCRELVAWTAGDNGVEVIKRFESECHDELQLKNAAMKGMSYWKQGNVGASRKQVAPMLRKAMN